jgi:hypothetical protein
MGPGAIVVIVILAWIAPVVLAPFLATRRSRSGVGGFLLGLFLGWVGVGIVLLLGEREGRAPQPTAWRSSAAREEVDEIRRLRKRGEGRAQRAARERALAAARGLPRAPDIRACTNGECRLNRVPTKSRICEGCAAKTYLVSANPA